MPTLNEISNIFPDVRTTVKDSGEIVAKKIAMLLEQALGKHGWDYISDTDTHAGPYIGLQACEATVVATITGEQISETSVSMAATQTTPGHITEFQLASGSVIAFKAVS